MKKENSLPPFILILDIHNQMYPGHCKKGPLWNIGLGIVLAEADTRALTLMQNDLVYLEHN